MRAMVVRMPYLTKTLQQAAKLPTEHDEQVAVIRWWRGCCLQFDCLPEELFSVPNGGLRSRTFATNQFFRDEGLVRGVADLCLAVPSADGTRSILWIEMKRRKGGVQSPEQKAFAERVESRGQAYVLAKGAEQAIDAINTYLRSADERI